MHLGGMMEYDFREGRTQREALDEVLATASGWPNAPCGPRGSGSRFFHRVGTPALGAGYCYPHERWDRRPPAALGTLCASGGESRLAGSPEPWPSRPLD
jgi:hypothetical protein